MKTGTFFALGLLLASVLFAQPSQARQPNPWTFLGPQPIGNQGGNVSDGDGWVGPRPIAGRVLSVVVVDAKTVYVGTSGGGVWKTTDGGLNWKPKTDSQPSLTIGALALDPTNQNVVYAGTGDFNVYYDAYSGVGILRSADAGETWTLLPDPNGVFVGAKVGRVAVDPANPKNIYAATNRGLAISLDGGQSWKSVKMGACSQISDVAVDDSTTPSTVYAASSPVDSDWYTTDSPSCNGLWKGTQPSPSTVCVGPCLPQFSKLPTAVVAVDPQINYVMPESIPAGNNMRLATSRYLVTSVDGKKSKKVTLYVAMQVYLKDSPDKNRLFDLRVLKSDDGGAHWTPLAMVAPGNYSCWGIAVHRISDSPWYPVVDVIYVLSQELFISANGGNNWQKVTADANGALNRKVHVDLHGFDFVPGGAKQFFLGADGGMYKSEDYGQSFKNLNATLGNVNFYRGAVSNEPNPKLLGSMQDSGFVRNFSTIGPSDSVGPLYSYWINPLPWMRVQGGDGGSIVWDPQDAKRIYITRSDNAALFMRSTDGGVSFQPAGAGIAPGGQTDLLAPLVMDPKNPKHLLAASNRLYESTDGAGGWKLVGAPSSADFPADGLAITAAAMASDSSAIYASHGAKVFKFANAAWKDVTAGLPNFYVVRTMAVDPANPNVVYAGLWAPPGTKRVKKLVGDAWVDASTNLPDADVNSIVINPGNPKDIFAATNQGSYRSTNGGDTWHSISNGMPKAIAYDLVLDQTGTTLYVFTHGRGVRRAYVKDLPA